MKFKEQQTAIFPRRPYQSASFDCSRDCCVGRVPLSTAPKTSETETGDYLQGNAGKTMKAIQSERVSEEVAATAKARSFLLLMLRYLTLILRVA